MFVKPISTRAMVRNLQLLLNLSAHVTYCSSVMLNLFVLHLTDKVTLKGGLFIGRLVCHWIDNSFERSSALIGFLPEVEQSCPGVLDHLRRSCFY